MAEWGDSSVCALSPSRRMAIDGSEKSEELAGKLAMLCSGDSSRGPPFRLAAKIFSVCACRACASA